MDRDIVYPGALPLDTDILNLNRRAMIALGYLAQMAVGSTTVVDGLSCTPTSPATLTVNVGPGSILSLETVDSTAYGSLPADTADPLVKMGINWTGSTPFTLTAPASSGQSINYLIEATFLEADATPVVLPYYNAANPSQPYSGPSNSGTAQNTVRQQTVELQLKAGAAANTGTQTTPAVDAGWVGLYVITVNYGQTQIIASGITVYPGAPFVAYKLGDGAPFASRARTLAANYTALPEDAGSDFEASAAVTLTLPAASTMTGQTIGFRSTVAGSTLAVASGTLEGGTLQGATSAAIGVGDWLSAQAGAANWRILGAAPHLVGTRGSEAFLSSGTFTVPAGVFSVLVTCVGGGGGGSQCDSQSTTPSSTNASGGGGGAGGTAIGIYAVTPGQAITVTIGGGGITNGSGGTTSFGSFCSATGGSGSSFTATAVSPGGAGGTGSGGDVNIEGGYGSDGQNASFVFAGNGGNSIFGGGGRAGAHGGEPGGAPGAGGGGAYDALATSTVYNGGTGANGIVLVRW